MDEQICEYLALKNKIKGWFIYGLGREDDEDLDNMVDQIAFMAIGRTQPDASMTVQSLSNARFSKRSREEFRSTLERWGLADLPPKLVKDLEKLGDMENDIGSLNFG
jgi:hypothetical protein